MCAPVVAHGYPSPVLDVAEHVLDLVALFVEFFAVAQPVLSMPARRDAGRDALFRKGGAEPVGVVAAVGNQFFCFRQAVQQAFCARVLTDLPRSQQ